MDNDRPLLLVVTGRPGSGKTTLAHRLAQTIRCPAVCRDEVKEGWVNTTGEADGDDVGRRVYGAFFDVVALLIDRRITVVAEAAFQHKLWAPKLEPLRAVARVRVVVCAVDPSVARAREVARGLADPARDRFHGDPAVRAAREGRELPIGEYVPPALNVPTLTVDTTAGYWPCFDDIAAFASAA